MAIHSTPVDACPVGCGEGLFFLASSKNGLFLFFCPSCQGLWDNTVFNADGKEAKLYDPRELEQHEIILPSVETIQSQWKGAVNTPSASKEEFFNQSYYLKWLRSAFKDKLDETSVES